MEYRLKKTLNPECLAIEDSSGQTLYFDKAGFVIQLRDNLRLGLQKELKAVIRSEDSIRHENLIQYTAMDKFDGEIYLIRKDGPSHEISPWTPDGLEASCRVLLTILRIIKHYHEQGIPLKGLSLGQLKQDQNGDFRLQDPPVMNYLSSSLESVYRIDLPPEVIRGGHWNESSDIFSWGQLAYRLLGGEDPFSAKTSEERIDKIMKAGMLDLRDLQPKINPQLSQSVMDCLNPLPQKRPTIGTLIEQLQWMIAEGSCQISDEAAENYTEKARKNRIQYHFSQNVKRWYKKYKVPVYVSLAILLFLGLILATRPKGVLTVNTPPRMVVDYYYHGIQTLNPPLVGETLHKVNKQASFDELVINLYVSNRTRQYVSQTAQDTITVSFPKLKITRLSHGTLMNRFQADYLLKIDSINEIINIKRTEELTVKPIRKIWRITNIRVIREKRWTEKVEPSPPPQT